MMNVLNPGAEKSLYSKVLNISVKGLASDDSRFQKLTLNLEWLPNASSHKKVLTIHLTNSNDPFFYYMANISEDDFVNMKRQQDLLVDFPSFSEMFINLLEQCIAEDAKPQPKLVLSLYMDTSSELHRTAVLDVVEKNRFKHIVHLSLLLPEVSNVLQKQYITTCYRNLKEGKERLESQYSAIQQDLTKQLQNCEESNDTRVRELEELLKKKDEELSKKEQRTKSELRKVKDDLSKRYKEDIARLESKLKQKDDSHKRNVNELETKIKCLNGINDECAEKLNKKSKEIRELKLKFDSLQSAHQELQEREQVMVDENKKLETLVAEKKRKIIELSQETCSLQIIRNEHEVTIAQLRLNFESIAGEKEYLKNQVSKLESQCAKKDEVVKELRANQAGANTVIDKFQMQIKELKEKLKNGEKTIQKQDELISKKTSHCKHLEHELATVIKRAEEDRQEVEKIRGKFDAMEAQLKDSQETIRMKTSLIEYLDQQLFPRNEALEHDSPLNGEQLHRNGISGMLKEVVPSPMNQIPGNEPLDDRYLQWHHPLPSHNPMDEHKPSSCFEEVYREPLHTNPPVPFQPFPPQIYSCEPANRSSGHNPGQSIRSRHNKSRSPSSSLPRMPN